MEVVGFHGHQFFFTNSKVLVKSKYVNICFESVGFLRYQFTFKIYNIDPLQHTDIPPVALMLGAIKKLSKLRTFISHAQFYV